jgi:hypothetical protein
MTGTAAAHDHQSSLNRVAFSAGAMEAGLVDALFWGSLAFALAVAFVTAYPVNRYLIARGKGHAVVHAHPSLGPEEDRHDRPAGKRRP